MTMMTENEQMATDIVAAPLVSCVELCACLCLCVNLFMLAKTNQTPNLIQTQDNRHTKSILEAHQMDIANSKGEDKDEFLSVVQRLLD